MKSLAMVLGVILLVLCVWNAVLVVESKGRQKRCFAPVTCSIDDQKNTSPEWMQVYPSLECNSCQSKTCSDTSHTTETSTIRPTSSTTSTTSPGSDLNLESVRTLVEDMFPRYYAGKTFIPLLHEYVKRGDAIARCRAIGGKLANIYDQKHQMKIMKYVRANANYSIPREDEDGHGTQLIVLTLGMTYNSEDSKIVMSNGTEFNPNKLKWGHDFPNGTGKHVYLAVAAPENVDVEEQYFVNLARETDGFPLCEI